MKEEQEINAEMAYLVRNSFRSLTFTDRKGKTYHQHTTVLSDALFTTREEESSQFFPLLIYLQ